MLWADPMPGSNDAALQKGERGFNGIGVNISHDIDMAAVIDRSVRHASNFRGVGIGSKIVCNNHVHVGFDVLSNVLRKRSGFHVIRMEQPEFAIALANPDHDLFVIILGSVPFADGTTTDVRFVHLHGAGEFALGRFHHRSADSVTEIPCGFVADSERPMYLMCRDALLRFTQKQRSHEPLLKREMRVIKDRACRYSKLIVAALAVEELLVSLKLYSRVITAQTVRAIGPAQAAKQFSAFFGRSVATYERC